MRCSRVPSPTQLSVYSTPVNCAKRCEHVGESVWGHREVEACHVEGYQFRVHVAEVAWSERFSMGCVFVQRPVARALHEAQLLASPCRSVPDLVQSNGFPYVQVVHIGNRVGADFHRRCLAKMCRF